MSTIPAVIQSFAQHLSQVGFELLGLAVLLHLTNLLLRATAWREILKAAVPGHLVPWKGVTGAYLAGAGMNGVLPARGGDVAKVVLVNRSVPGASCAVVASGLLVETLLDAVVGGALLTWAIWSGAVPTRLLEFRPPGGSGVVVVIASVLIGAVVIAAGRARGHAARLAHRLRQGVAILESPRAYLRLVVLPQALGWMCRVASMYCFLHAFHVGGGLNHAALALVAGSVTSVMPLTPGGLGTQQALLMVLLAGVATPATVLSFSVGTQLVMTTVNVLVGGVCMGLLLRMMPWRVRLSVPTEPEPVPIPLPVSTSGE
ncbi:MAG: glycosyltransferase AglD [Gaiellales bacterium]|nr:glycosyltransferase AglD [Gaiellales bacterium]